MRSIFAIAAPAIVLSSCSDSALPEDPAEPLAGEWEIAMTVTSFEVPGASTEQAQIAAEGANVGATQTNKHCMSPAEAEKGVQGIIEAFRQGSCTDETLEIVEGEFDASMQCRMPFFEGRVPVEITGEIANTEFQMVMTSQLASDDFPDGNAKMTMAVAGRRVGGC